MFHSIRAHLVQVYKLTKKLVVVVAVCLSQHRVESSQNRVESNQVQFENLHIYIDSQNSKIESYTRPLGLNYGLDIFRTHIKFISF